MMTKNINGVLLLNKPLGMSSNKAVQKVKWLYQAKKAGHTGTLDPLATGLLPICFGEATKFSSFLLAANKEYIATIKLGVATTTYDSEGEITAKGMVTSSLEDIKACLTHFLGRIRQIPPLYSALKVKGRALYEYARNKVEVVVNPREVEVFELDILEFIQPDVLRLRVLCSKGTYIRSLAHDMGTLLGCGAHLIGLIRTKTNDFSLNNSVTIDDISKLNLTMQQDLLLPVNVLVSHLNKFTLSEEQFAKVKNGHQFIISTFVTGHLVALYYDCRFLGIAQVERSMIKPLRLINIGNVKRLINFKGNKI